MLILLPPVLISLPTALNMLPKLGLGIGLGLGLQLGLRSGSGLVFAFRVRVRAEVLVATAWFLGNSSVGSRWQSLGCHVLATRQACFC